MDTDLDRVIRSRQALTEEHLSYFLYQILCAVHYIHSAAVVHRDLKPGNVLVNGNCDLKICDFGLARAIQEHEGVNQQNAAEHTSTAEAELTDYVCTRWWRAPEVVLLAGQYSKSVDLWSVGCILGDLLCRKVLFQGKDHMDQLKKIIQVIGTPSDADLDYLPLQCPARKFISRLPQSSKQPWSTLFPAASQQAVEALDAMICFNPVRRATAKEALALPFFSDLYQQEDLKTANSPVDWQFDSCRLTKRSLQNLIFVECHDFHPEQPFEAHVVALHPEAPTDDGSISIHCRSLGGDLLMTIVANETERIAFIRANIAQKLDEPAELIRLVAEDSRVLNDNHSVRAAMSSAPESA